MPGAPSPVSGIVIDELVAPDVPACVALWNEACEGPRALVYKHLAPAAFSELFMTSAADVAVVNLVARSGEEIVGFASGTVRTGAAPGGGGHGGGQGYITVVLVRDDQRRRGIGRALLGTLETRLARASEGIDRYEVMFFNPVNLPWSVPGTDAHDHPNAPGVDVSCDGYLFLKNHGYRDIAYQNSYYLRLADYRYPPDIQERITRLEDDGIRIVRYDPALHHGLDELFDNLENDDWRETIAANLASDGPGDPVLIVEAGGRACGFTGPTRVQESGRGYFAGIGVHSDYRGRGAGKVLFAALCMQLKEIGASFMTLFTGEANPARNIYEAAGFRIVRAWADMRKTR